MSYLRSEVDLSGDDSDVCGSYPLIDQDVHEHGLSVSGDGVVCRNRRRVALRLHRTAVMRISKAPKSGKSVGLQILRFAYHGLSLLGTGTNRAGVP